MSIKTHIERCERLQKTLDSAREFLHLNLNEKNVENEKLRTQLAENKKDLRKRTCQISELNRNLNQMRLKLQKYRALDFSYNDHLLSALLQAGKHLQKDQNILQKLEQKDEKIESLEDEIANLTRQREAEINRHLNSQTESNTSCSICFHKVRFLKPKLFFKHKLVQRGRTSRSLLQTLWPQSM